MSCLKKKNKDEFHVLTKKIIKCCCFSGFLFEITTKMEVYSGKAKRQAWSAEVPEGHSSTEPLNA